MIKVLLVIAAVMLTIYCVVEVAQSRKYEVRMAPKWLWAFAVIVLPVVGPLTWLAFGRPKSTPQPPQSVAPDDNEDFLRGIR